MPLRFDDTLETVLAGDLRSAVGAPLVWRQLVDLLARGRVTGEERAMEVLESIRHLVPLPVRAASARALDGTEPPAALVRLLATDELSVAIPVLSNARLETHAWIGLLPALAPGARHVLRNRRDLGPEVARALESFGPSDFVLADQSAALAEAVPAQDGAHVEQAAVALEDAGPFAIADLVARIEAYHRERDTGTAKRAAERARNFRFETDASGVVRWVDGVDRAPLVGLSLDLQGLPGGSRLDGVAAGAFRRRAGFSNARLTIEGRSNAAGDWLVSALPVFEQVTGRFSGYRGTARRPRPDERAEPVRGAPVEADALRQIVHELRTPTNAIAGFAEMIETQMLGPVPEPYRDRAAVIRAQARELLGAIDDLDLAARIETAALSLREGKVALRPLLAGIVADLGELLTLRGSAVLLPDQDVFVSGDRRAVERLIARLMATLVSATVRDERIRIRFALDGEQHLAIAIDRPRALGHYPGETVLGIDDEQDGDETLLGTGFALRLARNLARELGGSLRISPDLLTLRLPAATAVAPEQAQRS
ncbi:sensor histidine kinase [Sphingomonas sp. TDK1]|uniref:sensor histidine kinase n=1 Tax=Sphingomonas sp. TDK1 TaxID=453247 RepID=UPI0007D8FED1|nr:HAMP domain-containing sensor histidine kinase [Sphingomonas sp. TDK1]OAN64782.1 histidine kinase [Sphingomonas sp. TDK1]